MSARERIEAMPGWCLAHPGGLARTGCGGRWVERCEVLALIDEPWQDRPEPGDWWVSLHPDQRLFKNDTVHKAVVDSDSFVWFASESPWAKLNAEIFSGAKWQRRTTPADPFAKEKVQP